MTYTVVVAQTGRCRDKTGNLVNTATVAAPAPVSRYDVPGDNTATDIGHGRSLDADLSITKTDGQLDVHVPVSTV